MIAELLFDCIFSSLRVVFVLFPMFLIFEGITRQLNAKISGRVGPKLGISWIDYLKSLTKAEQEKKERIWLDVFFVLAVAMFSLVPWFGQSNPNEFEIRLHLYFSLTVLFLVAHFFLLYRREEKGTRLFPSEEIFFFFLMIGTACLNEATLILQTQQETTGFFPHVLSGVVILIQIFIGLVLFYFQSGSKKLFEKKMLRSRLTLFHFSKFVAVMSWICLHFSLAQSDNRITLGAFLAGFVLFITMQVFMSGYTYLNEKLTGILIWKYLFPTSLLLFLVVLVGDWIR